MFSLDCYTMTTASVLTPVTTPSSPGSTALTLSSRGWAPATYWGHEDYHIQRHGAEMAFFGEKEMVAGSSFLLQHHKQLQHSNTGSQRHWHSPNYYSLYPCSKSTPGRTSRRNWSSSAGCSLTDNSGILISRAWGMATNFPGVFLCLPVWCLSQLLSGCFSVMNIPQISTRLHDSAVVTRGAATESWMLSPSSFLGGKPSKHQQTAELLPCLPEPADGMKLGSFHFSRMTKSET